jgi:hypothetical protein
LPATLDRTSSNRAPEQKQSASGKGGWALVRTATIWATALFLTINVLLWKVAGEEKTISKDLWSGSGSIDLAVDGFKVLKKPPTVVLLGSSLMMFPFFAMDVERDKSLGDIFHHHGSAVLTEKLQNAGFKNPSVYSLAIFGQMSSDAFIYVNEYLQGDKSPDWLVLGIAPRDFSDHDLPAPTATFTFKRLVGLSNFSRYAELYLPTWQDKIEFLCSHVCFFYNRRWRLQQEFDKALNKVYGWAGIESKTQTGKATEATAGFMLNGTTEQRWENSLKEYRRRYRDIGERDLSLQMRFLDRLLSVCQERHIRVVLVNMPLSGANRALLPGEFYCRFRGQIADLAGKHQAKMLDLGDSSEFVKDDFWDTTHLNHFGGHKLVNHLMRVMEIN